MLLPDNDCGPDCNICQVFRAACVTAGYASAELPCTEYWRNSRAIQHRKQSIEPLALRTGQKNPPGRSAARSRRNRTARWNKVFPGRLQLWRTLQMATESPIFAIEKKELKRHRLGTVQNGIRSRLILVTNAVVLPPPGHDPA